MPTLAELAHVVVPIDAIPMAAMRITPDVAPGLVIAGLGTVLGRPAGLPPSGEVERSGEKYHYNHQRSGAGNASTPPQAAVLTPTLDGTDAPAVWWTLRGATEANTNAQLALLTWEPTPATKAIEKTDRLTETVRERWGTVCMPASPPTEVLWTFRWERYGPSATGWQLEGQAWPDAPGTRRSQAADTGPAGDGALALGRRSAGQPTRHLAGLCGGRRGALCQAAGCARCTGSSRNSRCSRLACRAYRRRGRRHATARSV